MKRLLRRLRRRLVVWWHLHSGFGISLAAERAGRRSGWFAASAMYGGRDRVPSYVREMLVWRRR
jgi:hypothetical protein